MTEIAYAYSARQLAAILRSYEHEVTGKLMPEQVRVSALDSEDTCIEVTTLIIEVEAVDDEKLERERGRDDV